MKTLLLFLLFPILCFAQGKLTLDIIQYDSLNRLNYNNVLIYNKQNAQIFNIKDSILIPKTSQFPISDLFIPQKEHDYLIVYKDSFYIPFIDSSFKIKDKNIKIIQGEFGVIGMIFKTLTGKRFFINDKTTFEIEAHVPDSIIRNFYGNFLYLKYGNKWSIFNNIENDYTNLFHKEKQFPIAINVDSFDIDKPYYFKNNKTYYLYDETKTAFDQKIKDNERFNFPFVFIKKNGFYNLLGYNGLQLPQKYIDFKEIDGKYIFKSESKWDYYISKKLNDNEYKMVYKFSTNKDSFFSLEPLIYYENGLFYDENLKSYERIIWAKPLIYYKDGYYFHDSSGMKTKKIDITRGEIFTNPINVNFILIYENNKWGAWDYENKSWYIEPIMDKIFKFYNETVIVTHEGKPRIYNHKLKYFYPIYPDKIVAKPHHYNMRTEYQYFKDGIEFNCIIIGKEINCNP